MKGLIALDALQTKGPLDFTDVPAWLVVAYKLDVVKGKVHSITMRSEPANAASITESKSEKLSRTEGEILSLIREGLTDKEIATKRNKNYGTIKKQVSEILRKLKVKNRTEAAVKTLPPATWNGPADPGPFG